MWKSKKFSKKKFFLKKNQNDRIVAHGRFSTVAKFRDEKMEDKKVMGIGAEEQFFGVRRVAACGFLLFPTQLPLEITRFSWSADNFPSDDRFSIGQTPSSIFDPEHHSIP